MAKVLFFDIETSPNEGRFWRPGRKVNIDYRNIKRERRVVCICWQWLGQDRIFSLDWGDKQCDKDLLGKFSEVIDKADLVVAHNGTRFDIRWIKGRIAFHGLPPLKEVRCRDTLTMTKRAFDLNSYRLDYLGEYFGLGRKLKTGGYELWDSVMDGDESALRKMVKYCKQDVRLLSAVYKIVNPYVAHTFHMGVIRQGSELACKACGSMRTKWDSHRVAHKIVYRCRKCNECGHFWRTNERVNA